MKTLFKPGIRSGAIIGSIFAIVVCFFLLAQLSINNSQRVQIAKHYIQSSADVRNEVGEILDYGFFVSNPTDRNEEKSFVGITVHGTKDSRTIRVSLTKNRSGEWIVDHLEIR